MKLWPIPRLLLLPFLGVYLWMQPAHAQSIVTEPNGTQTIVTADGKRFNISGGSLSGDGANLFHSFKKFGLSQGEIATFLSNPGIQNILGRVNGGDASIINGLIQVQGSNANLYLMNPAGIVFGPNATINVPADFRATTATGIGFEKGWFNTIGDNDYAALGGTPQSLLFNTDQPGSIVNAGNLAVAKGQNLSLIGGTVVNTGSLSAEGGQVTLAAVPGQRRVRINHPDMLLSLEVKQLDPDTTEPFRAVSLSELLTGGDVPVATGVEVDAAGRTWLLNTPVATGDVAISGEVSGDQVQLAAANHVNVMGDSEKLITTHNGQHSAPIVTRFNADGTNANELVFLDTTVPDYQRLLFGTEAGTTTVAIPVSENGIERVTSVLQQVGAVDAVHIVSEGDEGEFWLGNAYVSNETLDKYKAHFQQWGGLLSTEADILIYACLTARGPEGLALLNKIAELTHADVAGSTDLTGDTARGGNWILEQSIGSIETGSAFEATTLADYKGLLQVFTATDAASLIAAINLANGNTETDTINLANNITLAAVDNATNGANGLPSITAPEKLTINGMGNTLARDTTAPDFRLIHVALGAELEVNDITLTGGIANSGGQGDDGGAIHNRGTLTVNNSIITGNTAADDGGAISSFNTTANAVTVTINNSTISGNTAMGNGGALSNTSFTGAGPNSTVMTVNNSTITGNNANVGGGIAQLGQNANNSAVVIVNNSTISGNTVVFGGGGIYNRGQTSLLGATITITNSTIVQNEVTNPGSSSGGILNLNFLGGANTARVTVANSIIALNTATVFPDVRRASATNSPIIDAGNNLIGVDNQGIFTTSTLVGSVATPLDPMLLPLGDYGGPTQTHAFFLDSPALNAGSDALAMAATLTTDQRGANRFNGTVDIGAVESQGYSLAVTAGNNQTTTVNTAFTTALEAQVTENFANSPLPVSGLNVTFTATPSPTGATGSFNGNPTTTVVTNATGVATAPTLTANTVAGSYVISSSSGTLTPASFNLTNTPDVPALLTISGGNDQSTTVNTAFANTLDVTVTDQFGNLVPNTTLNYSAPSTGASSTLSATTATTDSNGVARVSATGNTVAGSYVISSSSGTLAPVSFNLTNTPDVPALLTISGGNNQSTTVNTAFANTLDVTVTDQFGNLVPNTTLNYSAPSTGASSTLSATTATTDNNGVASVSATANDTAGTFTVTATGVGVTAGNFTLTNSPIAPTTPDIPATEFLGFWTDLQELSKTSDVACGAVPTVNLEVDIDIPDVQGQTPPPEESQEALGADCP
ncbi:DUF4347 domain-containing protein [Acaryochloris marina]|nr:DUF4347 domain-containing protein [Acaryochloris marina]